MMLLGYVYGISWRDKAEQGYKAEILHSKCSFEITIIVIARYRGMANLIIT